MRAARETARRSTVSGLAAAALVLSTAACEFSFNLGGDSAVGREQVAEEAARVLEAEVGRAPDSLTCEEDLPAEVGASIRCELTDGGTSYGVTVTTTGVQGSDVDFDVQVDEQPAG